MEPEKNTKRKRTRKRKYSISTINPYALLAARLGLQVDEKNTTIFIDGNRKRYVLMPHGFVPVVRTNAQEALRVLEIEYKNLQDKYAAQGKSLEKQKQIAQDHFSQLRSVQKELETTAKELDVVVKQLDVMKKEDDTIDRKRKSAIYKILGSKFRSEVKLQQIADYLIQKN